MQLTGCTAKSLAGLICVSQASISKALSLLSLPTEVQSQVASGDLSPKAGQAIAKIKNPEVAKKVARKAAETKAPVTEVEKDVRQRQGTPAKATQAQPFVQFKIARGTRVVIHGRLTGREVLAALEAAVEMARDELEQSAGEEEWVGARTGQSGPPTCSLGHVLPRLAYPSPADRLRGNGVIFSNLRVRFPRSTPGTNNRDIRFNETAARDPRASCLPITLFRWPPSRVSGSVVDFGGMGWIMHLCAYTMHRAVLTPQVDLRSSTSIGLVGTRPEFAIAFRL